MPRPISYAVFCLKKKRNARLEVADAAPAAAEPAGPPAAPPEGAPPPPPRGPPREGPPRPRPDAPRRRRRRGAPGGGPVRPVLVLGPPLGVLVGSAGRAPLAFFF